MESWRGDSFQAHSSGFHITNQGILTLKLTKDIRVDMTIDQAIRVINYAKGIIVALNANGTSSTMIHPGGRIYQYGSRVEIATNGPVGNSKYAKMWHKGISFTSEHCAVIYLVDGAGIRTISDTFSDTNGDFSVPIFLTNSKFGEDEIPEWESKLQENVQYWISQEGSENWTVNGIRISITNEGLVRVTRGPSKYSIRVGMNGLASLTTPYLHATASNTHLFAKRGERRMHFDGRTFIVRNGGHSAGLDDESQLKVY